MMTNPQNGEEMVKKAEKAKNARLAVDCTTEERLYIKMLATKNDMTISEYIMSHLRYKFPGGKQNKPLMESKKDVRELWHNMDMDSKDS